MKKTLRIAFVSVAFAAAALGQTFEVKKNYTVTNYVAASASGGTNLFHPTATNDMRFYRQVTWYAKFWGESTACTTNLDVTFIGTPDPSGTNGWLTETQIVSFRADGTNLVWQPVTFSNYQYALMKPALWTNYNSGALTGFVFESSNKGYTKDR
jgi:hypothetical protein